MKVSATNKGVVVRYQDEDNPDEGATVQVTPDPDGEGVRVDLRRAAGETTFHLSYYDSLALAAALTAAEVPEPPRERK